MVKPSIQKRRQARFLLIQALYQALISETYLELLLPQFRANPQFYQADQDYFAESLQAILAQEKKLDAIYEEFLDRTLTDLDPIETCILRLATYELAEHPDIPYRVIINEALELAKIFGGTDAHKYVNGVIDKTARKLRITEIASQEKKHAQK